jgi:hypothetical protein
LMKKKTDFSLTVSGFEYDKDLSRVPIKVFPALQTLVANQYDLIKIIQEHVPEQSIFLESHLSELVEVEETIQKEYTKYCAKREEQRKKRQENAKSKKSAFQDNENSPVAWGDGESLTNELLRDEETVLDSLAATLSPGLPSAKFEKTSNFTRTGPENKGDNDVRRIAIGASIKALSNLLGRQLTDMEISVIEAQVDAYL